MSYRQGWPAVGPVLIARERLLPAGTGEVQAHLQDIVEPQTVIVLGNATNPPLLAGLRGRVTHIIPERGVVVQGPATVIGALAGCGTEAMGPLTLVTGGVVQGVTAGAILVIPGELSATQLQAGIAGRAAGIFAASARPEIIEPLLGIDATTLLDNTRAPTTTPPCAIGLLHGFGTQSMDAMVWQLLGAHIGQSALLLTHTDIRHGINPELIIPLPAQASARVGLPDLALVEGAFVWVTGGDYAGAAGRINTVLRYGQTIPSGLRTPVARVRLESGTEVTVAMANLQRVG